MPSKKNQATSNYLSASLSFENDRITYTNPKGVFRLDEDASGWEANAASTYGFTFSASEAF